MTHQLRDNLPPLPARIKKLPVDARGYPVPYFVTWLPDGTPDFRVADARKLIKCVKENLCWICGEVLGAHRAFTIGPMCAINRVSAEPPAHLECADFSVQACPFLIMPKAQRRDADIPAGTQNPPGIMIMRNPGVTLVWVTSHYQQIQQENGFLFRLGDPTKVGWFAEGKAANRKQVMDSIGSGLPILFEMASKEGFEAMADLCRATVKATALLPLI